MNTPDQDVANKMIILSQFAASPLFELLSDERKQALANEAYALLMLAPSSLVVPQIETRLTESKKG